MEDVVGQRFIAPSAQLLGKKERWVLAQVGRWMENQHLCGIQRYKEVFQLSVLWPPGSRRANAGSVGHH